MSAAWTVHRPRVLSALLASLTLGLLPFYPHPHIYKQIMNIVNGTLTEWIDVLDLVMHGAPWLYLFFALQWFGREAIRARDAQPDGSRA